MSVAAEQLIFPTQHELRQFPPRLQDRPVDDRERYSRKHEARCEDDHHPAGNHALARFLRGKDRGFIHFWIGFETGLACLDGSFIGDQLWFSFG